MGKRKHPAPRKSLPREEVERRAREREKLQSFVEKEAERERNVGLEHVRDRPDPLSRTSGGWRDKSATVPQQRALRRLGLNPLAYRTRGAATDAISAAKG